MASTDLDLPGHAAELALNALLAWTAATIALIAVSIVVLLNAPSAAELTRIDTPTSAQHRNP